MLRCLSVRLVALAIMINLVGCVESSFNLSDDARLPKWFDIPEGMVREELTVTMDYYVMPSGGKAVFKLFDQNGKRLQKVKGVTRGKYPIELKSPPSGYPEGYPSYEIITVGGVTDIIEHRYMEPVFYVTDDPKIWEELGVKPQEG